MLVYLFAHRYAPVSARLLGAARLCARDDWAAFTACTTTQRLLPPDEHDIPAAPVPRGDAPLGSVLLGGAPTHRAGLLRRHREDGACERAGASHRALCSPEEAVTKHHEAPRADHVNAQGVLR
jgi:hypothetical protein